MNFCSPLRYPGGKRKIVDYIKQVFESNLLYDGVYVEPFAGGASVALSLLFNEYASKAVINDIDISIYAFWFSVLNKTEELCKLIYDTPVNLRTWEQQQAIQKEKSNQSLTKLGFSTFFLNRTNHSGILKAGVIGGRHQTGRWKIDARFNKKDLINRIHKIALYKDKIKLYNHDAITLIKNLKRKLPKKTLFYFDPPYYLKGKDLYLNYYKINDHKLIANEIKNIEQQKWIVTYDNVNFIQKLYKNYRQIKYTLNYSVKNARKGKELMIFSNNLHIPNSFISG